MKINEFKELILEKFDNNFDIIEENFENFSTKYWGKKIDQIENIHINEFFTLFICFYPYLYRSIKLENRNMSLKNELLERNSVNIIYLTDEEKKLEDIKNYYKKNPNILASCELDKEDLRKLLYNIYQDKELKFFFTLANNLNDFKNSLLLEVLVEEKELMTAYLKEVLGRTNEDFDVILQMSNFNIFFHATLEKLKEFFNNKQNNEYFIENIEGYYIPRSIFLLILDGNNELHEKYFVQAVSIKNKHLDYSIYIREIKLSSALEKDNIENRIIKKKI